MASVLMTQAEGTKPPEKEHMRREGYLAHGLMTGKPAMVADLRPYRVLLTDGR